MFATRTGPRAVLTGLCAAAAIGSAASAAGVRVTITTHQASGGLFMTPLLASFHDGNYDAFSAGSAASAGVEALAETGNSAVEIGANRGRNFSAITSPGGFAGAPVIDPGETSVAGDQRGRVDRAVFFIPLDGDPLERLFHRQWRPDGA